jgi:hypothetical protein
VPSTQALHVHHDDAMDSTLPDAFDASQPSLYAGQASSAGMVDPENTNGNMIASAPFVKVDGELSPAMRAGRLTVNEGK